MATSLQCRTGIIIPVKNSTLILPLFKAPVSKYYNNTTISLGLMLIMLLPISSFKRAIP